MLPTQSHFFMMLRNNSSREQGVVQAQVPRSAQAHPRVTTSDVLPLHTLHAQGRKWNASTRTHVADATFGATVRHWPRAQPALDVRQRLGNVTVAPVIEVRSRYRKPTVSAANKLAPDAATLREYAANWSAGLRGVTGMATPAASVPTTARARRHSDPASPAASRQLAVEFTSTPAPATGLIQSAVVAPHVATSPDSIPPLPRSDSERSDGAEVDGRDSHLIATTPVGVAFRPAVESALRDLIAASDGLVDASDVSSSRVRSLLQAGGNGSDGSTGTTAHTTPANL